ncbi:Chromatin modification-related protein [Musa troglodytarum]|uniref:Chromatin modification-related protein n=1 Tax=Musa troglodytarum TaxID=320322 RepID=A0A9E7I1W3_9LILI|nr:Chromatin modification-related protein [Musa troglodytarum]
MGLLGQRAVSNPSAVLSALVSKRDNLQDELRVIERQIYDLETTYLQDSNQNGSVLKGFEGFLSSSKSTANLKRSRRFQPEDRLFSLSSITSPVREGPNTVQVDHGVEVLLQMDRYTDGGFRLPLLSTRAALVPTTPKTLLQLPKTARFSS